ncbi:hypothetical protein QBC34DRAFT_306007 [Podospora aff. communis PSN243]|uniref:Uncharacterized protein n=1 Tax=Podospora aff. communis PSN243 TaxID=3040156 RepID=A0AAV9GCL6_9PEZI|nr:hypothetical protein QBC34DRAFT_306007 [Podospora aff. communis PSN243]
MPKKGRGAGALARQLVKVLFATALLAALVFVVMLTDRAEVVSAEKGPLPSYLTLDVSITITIVRAMQGVLAAVVAMILSQSFSYLQWGFLRSSKGGAPYVRQLALSPTTSVAGTIRLIFHRATGGGPRLWGFFRLLLLILTGLGGIVLFFRTSLVVVFDTTHSYPVTAGVGPFNASYVAPFFQALRDLAPSYEFNTLPYSYYGPVHDLVVNPYYTTTTEPVDCQAAVKDDGADVCAAYILSGGLVLTTPWIPTGYPDHPQIVMENVPTIHAEFSALPAGKLFEEAECRLYGSNRTRIGVKFCLSQSEPSRFDTGIFVCRDGVSKGVCKTTNPTPNVTTSFSLYRRFGTVLGAKSNYTILSASNLTAPQPISFSSSDIEAYNSVLDWLLDFAKADVPAMSSIVETFWSSKNQLEQPFTSAIMLRNFRSILLFPVWLFNANNFGNPSLKETEIVTDLPAEHYVTASVVRPYTKIKFDPTLVATFVVFQGLALIFGWLILVWSFCVRRSMPEISSFPLFDAEFKADARGQSVPDARSVWLYRDKEILDAMSNARVERRVI